MVSKSFAITGRVIDNGVRRLKQNVRHLLNIFMPRGVEPSADGWKLSLRNRMVHARVRGLFRNAEEWDHDAWGEPLSGAHMALASAVFSARMINYAVMLGASLDDDERASAYDESRDRGFVSLRGRKVTETGGFADARTQSNTTCRLPLLAVSAHLRGVAWRSGAGPRRQPDA